MFELIKSATFESSCATGRAYVPGDLTFLADHFPGVPVLPGSLQLELCAQLAGPLAEAAVARDQGVERWAFLGLVRNASFHAAVHLPIELTLTAELVRVEPSSVVVATVARRGDDLTCRAELVMVMREAEAGWTDAIAQARARVARWTSGA
jgi:3-hydroxymyristoyl/3-hydroxydecanoyl-(acyl carrier protein) dehydratase